MKITSIILALIFVVTAPASFEARHATASFELNDMGHSAIDHLVRRGFFDEASLFRLEVQAQVLPQTSPDDHLPRSLRSQSSHSISDGRKKDATRALKETVGRKNLEN